MRQLFLRGSLGEMARLMTEDHAFVDSRGGRMSGRETMVSAWKQFFGMFPDYQIEVESAGEAGGFVAVFGWARGTYRGRRGLVPENKIEMPAAWRAVVEDGKIKIWQVYADWTEGSRIIEKDQKIG